MIVVVIFLALVHVQNSGAVDCVGCTSSQTCGFDGLCYDISDLVTCDTANYGYYCRRGQSCCGITGGCIPHDKICCSPNHRYCEPDHTCCGSHLCCPKEAECINGTCVLYTLRKRPHEVEQQTTAYQTRIFKRTFPTSTVMTLPSTTNRLTTHPAGKTISTLQTLYLTQKTSDIYHNFNRNYASSNRHLGSVFKWWYIALFVAGIGCVCVSLGLIVIIRRHTRSKALGQCNNFGIVPIAPAQTVGVYQNDDASNSVYDKGNPQQQTRNISFI
ncbi:uncharacterized protein LOC132740914 isoform X2 [Ruditapes philippinarum]|uniref:uncharacterized protein LOC132740914 isoform X2 n=1 Tax=Ruditapes philippinarum TaxID=129788 RepID=UPI00295B4944|nr:uncharacterized protein LOC132740914 isoform X2 [Ruditapes philippinarum]